MENSERLKCDRVKALLEEAYRIAPRDKARQWILWCDHYIKLYIKVLRTVELSTGERNKVQATISDVQTWREKFVERQLEGGGLQAEPRGRVTQRVRWKDAESAFEGRIRTGTIVNLRHKDLERFLNDARSVARIRLNNARKSEGNIKVNTILACKFRMAKSGGAETVVETKYFNTKNEVILPATDIKQWFDDYVKEPLLQKIEDFEEKESGWSLVEILHLMVNVNRYEPLSGAGFSTFIKTPHFLQSKRAIVNIENSDEFCFLWAVVAALCPAERNGHRISSYPHYSEATLPNTEQKLNYQGLNFPLPLKDVSKFEKMNGLSINVYGIEENEKREWFIAPYHLTTTDSSFPTIHLLLYCSDIHVPGDEQPVYHFAWIHDLSRLLSSQVSLHHGVKFFCDRCLCHFQEEKSYERHRADCCLINKFRMLLPEQEEDRILAFKNYKFKESVPFVVYADLECLLQPTTTANEEGDNVCQKHVAHSVAFYLKCSVDDSLSKFEFRRGPDCIAWFVKRLRDIGLMVDQFLRKIVPMEKLSRQQWKEYHEAKVCHICEEPFTSRDIKQWKHRDHCHFTGKYRGPAHRSCNLNYQDPHDIPIVFHNLSGYDAHFFIKNLAREFAGPITLLPITKEKYVTFKKQILGTDVNLRFIDSFRFMASSLDKLASYLDDKDKRITRKECNGDDEFRLLTRKGVFPYEYVDHWEKLEERQLPAKEEFFSTLRNEGVSEEDYAHACLVWEKFNISTLGEYSDLYLKTDVLLLADVFENFRQSCLAVYNLDALHYYTAPGLAFDAMLKHTEVKLELFTDAEMLLFVEKGIRGGVAQCTNRYAHANNRYMGENFDPQQEETYLMYYDVNNLYGAAMSEHLPYGSFEWTDPEGFDVLSVPDENEDGYILEVDLEYPVELHEMHKELPLCPQHFIPPNRKNTKLMTTLYDKSLYVIHYRNLKQCLSLGMKLRKIHRLLKFKQAQWLKSYIDLNTNMRKKSRNEFEKNFFKLMNNAVFGKTMENVRRRRDVKLISEWGGRYGARARIAQPNFHSSIIFNSDDRDARDLIIVELTRTLIEFNKPIYVGFAILDLSKIFIYKFHYDYVKATFGDHSKLMYTDTDSLLYHFRVPNIYEFIKRDISKFDTSDYPEENDYGMPRENKKVLGLMKDECNGKTMTDFVGLRAKLYTFKILGDAGEKKRAKGVKGSVIKTITFNDYKACLFRHKELYRTQHLIQSKNHDVRTIKQEKLALSWQDDKRVLLPYTTDTVPYGYNVK